MGKTDIINIIGEKLEEAERSQRWLAKKVDVNPMTMNNYVRNNRRIPAYVLYKVARVLGCTSDDLLREIPIKEEGEGEGEKE